MNASTSSDAERAKLAFTNWHNDRKANGLPGLADRDGFIAGYLAALGATASVGGDTLDAAPPVYFMRDNHTFRELPRDVSAAVDAICEELDKGHTSGSIFTKRPGAAPTFHFRYTLPRDQQLVLAGDWLTAEANARRAAIAATPEAP